VDLALHLGLGLAVSVLFVIMNGIIQGILELIETRKYGHGRIVMDIAERSSDGLEGDIRLVGWRAIASTGQSLGVPVAMPLGANRQVTWSVYQGNHKGDWNCVIHQWIMI